MIRFRAVARTIHLPRDVDTSRPTTEGEGLGFDPGMDPGALQDQVLGPLVHVIEEAAIDAPWALIGGTSVRLQGADAHSPNLEFITSEPALIALGEMLGMPADWGQGAHMVANRLHFMRHEIPVFVFGDPIFHGPYESLTPRDIPSLWDARVRVEVNGVGVLCTPLEWELILAVVLSARSRVEAIRAHMIDRGYDSRLVVRLLREGRVATETEDAVWSALEPEG
jgi:hypothetical protein